MEPLPASNWKVKLKSVLSILSSTGILSVYFESSPDEQLGLAKCSPTEREESALFQKLPTVKLGEPLSDSQSLNASDAAA